MNVCVCVCQVSHQTVQWVEGRLAASLAGLRRRLASIYRLSPRYSLTHPASTSIPTTPVGEFLMPVPPTPLSQTMLCVRNRGPAPAAGLLVQGGGGRAGGGAAGGVSTQAPAGPLLHEARRGALPPQEEDHGQPLWT